MGSYALNSRVSGHSEYDDIADIRTDCQGVTNLRIINSEGETHLMAHPEQQAFLKTVATSLGEDFGGHTILEVGSYDVTGSIRHAFKGADYTGVDLVEGPGVDLVADGSKLDLPDGSFDLTLSTECFEHNPFWSQTLANMYRMTKPGGLVVFSCATTGRFEHGTSRTDRASPGTQSIGWDYYRNITEKDVRRALDIDSLFPEYFFLVNRRSCDLYFVGLKTGGMRLFPFSAGNLRELCMHSQGAVKVQLAAESGSSGPHVPIAFRMISKFGQLPVRAARVLPDRAYQNFVIGYERALERIKAPVRRWL